MESYHTLQLVDMPISIISVLWVFSTVESLLLGFHHLNKDGASASCDNQYQILNMK
jgi:hypothetical protein